MTPPLISVVIPVCDGERYLTQALDSVLQQQNVEVEVIVVDDGSSDNTPAIIERYASRGEVCSIRIEPADKAGVGFARWAGVKIAKGDFVAFLDADDTFEPHKLSVQLEWMMKKPNAVLCYTGVTVIGNEENLDARQKQEIWFCPFEQTTSHRLAILRYLTLGNQICNSSVMVRRAVLEKVSGAYPCRQLFQYEDMLLWTLVAPLGNFLFISDRLTNYRYHDASFTEKVLRNPLVGAYAHLEMLLCLAARSRFGRVKIFALILAVQRTIHLIQLYSGNAERSQAVIHD